MSLLRRLRPRGIAGQIALLILASLAAMHLVLTLFFFGLQRLEDRPPAPPDGGGALLALIRVLDATPPDERERQLAVLNAAMPQLALRPSSHVFGPDEPAPGGPLDPFAQHFVPGYRVAAQVPENGSPEKGLRLLVQLRDGSVYAATMPMRQGGPVRVGPVAITLLFFAISVTVIGLWAARQLTAPLRAFSAAAENFSLSAEPSPIREDGPEEIRAASRALNRMLARIASLVEARTRLLAAVSHDLRTPITRLRLRSEFIQEAALRGQMVRDLDQMNRMVESALTFLRDEQQPRPRIALDLPSLLQTVCDGQADLGHDVAYEGPARLQVMGDPEEIERAVANLVENAVRHGGSARVSLAAFPGRAVIAVADEGPGIAEEEREALMEPFARGDRARGRDDGHGFGLGLSIARAIAEAHGGSLRLCANTPSGLVARLELPVAAPEAA